MSIRTLHATIGMLIAPSVLFFAFTGLLQIYGLHEAHGDYTPPPLIAKLSAVHQDQHFVAGHGHDDAEPHDAHDHADGDAPPHHDHDEELGTARTFLKAFFAAVAIGLFLSTLAGVWMALQQPLRRRTYLVLLLVGTILPFALAALAT